MKIKVVTGKEAKQALDEGKILVETTITETLVKNDELRSLNRLNAIRFKGERYERKNLNTLSATWYEYTPNLYFYTKEYTVYDTTRSILDWPFTLDNFVVFINSNKILKIIDGTFHHESISGEKEVNFKAIDSEGKIYELLPQQIRHATETEAERFNKEEFNKANEEQNKLKARQLYFKNEDETVAMKMICACGNELKLSMDDDGKYELYTDEGAYVNKEGTFSSWVAHDEFHLSCNACNRSVWMFT